MKKYGIFIVAALSSLSFSLGAVAKDGLVKSFGNAVNNSVKSSVGQNKNLKRGMYGKSTVEMADDKAAAAPVKKDPVAEPAVVTNTNSTGTPLDVNIVKKNQTKEDLLATGILYLSSNDLSKALDSFKKAQAISNDHVIQRWVDVVANKIKIKTINSQLEDVKPLIH
jgi:hypothetical protein